MTLEQSSDLCVRFHDKSEQFHAHSMTIWTQNLRTNGIEFRQKVILGSVPCLRYRVTVDFRVNFSFVLERVFKYIKINTFGFFQT